MEEKKNTVQNLLSPVSNILVPYQRGEFSKTTTAASNKIYMTVYTLVVEGTSVLIKWNIWRWKVNSMHTEYSRLPIYAWKTVYVFMNKQAMESAYYTLDFAPFYIQVWCAAKAAHLFFQLVSFAHGINLLLSQNVEN